MILKIILEFQNGQVPLSRCPIFDAHVTSAPVSNVAWS